MSCLHLRIAALLGAMLCPSPAVAGAWTLPEGAGHVLFGATVSQASRAFAADRSLQTTPRYSKVELQALMEYGVTDWLTAILKPGLQHVTIGAPTDARRSGFGGSELGARARLMHGPEWVLSAQATVRVPGTFDTSNPAAIGYTGAEVELRALFGASFAVGVWPAFIDVQFAQRFRTGGPPDETRVDLSLGLRTAQQWLLLAQSFSVVSQGSGSALFPATNYHKLQGSVIYAVTPQWSLQAGVFTTVLGRNALQENGLVLGAGYRF